jgi:hypothetical protein
MMARRLAAVTGAVLACAGLAINSPSAVRLGLMAAAVALWFTLWETTE